MEVEMDVAAIHHNHHHHHHHHHQHHQQQTLESMLHVCTKSQEDKKPPPPPPEQPLKCPRCDSSNTKFCYYNNYSLTQPRYFCKACRRYWTKGGTLRNVPVGGGCRKSNKRNSSSSSSANSCSASLKMRGPQQLQPNFTSASNSNHLLAGLPYDSSTCSDLSLAFARLQRQQQNIGSNIIGNLYDHFDQIDHHLGSSNNIGDQLGFIDNNNNNNNSNMTNLWYNGGGNNIGNGDHLINPMFHDHQEQELKQELACNMMRPAEVGLMGFPWNMVESGNMVHEVESGRSMIGGYWNGIGATNWHGLINSPLM